MVVGCAVALVLVACGDDVSVDGSGSGNAAADGGAGGTASVGGAGGQTTVSSTAATGGQGGARLPAQSCPPSQYAVDVDADGMLICAPFNGDVMTALETSCAFYAGWRDQCSGCTAGPSKVGRVTPASCENLTGADNTCTTATLGASAVSLFGLNTDGDVDGNDMFYAGWFCPFRGEAIESGPCADGEHAVEATPGRVACIPSDRLIAQYVRDHCAVYWGWRDQCDGCPQPPSKWGVQRGVNCTIGAGSDNSCAAPFVDQQWVPMVGINTDGDVDNNDSFYIGLHCGDGDTAEQSADRRCPFGTLVRGINEDGTLSCHSPSVDIAPAIRDGCDLFFGYRDECSGCTDPPEKWGSTSTGSCDAALASTCALHQLDGDMVQLLAINTDGDVDGNDKLYVGLSCN